MERLLWLCVHVHIGETCRMFCLSEPRGDTHQNKFGTHHQLCINPSSLRHKHQRLHAHYDGRKVGIMCLCRCWVIRSLFMNRTWCFYFTVDNPTDCAVCSLSWDLWQSDMHAHTFSFSVQIILNFTNSALFSCGNWSYLELFISVFSLADFGFNYFG